MKITIVNGEAQFTFDSTGKTIEPVCGVWGLGTDLMLYSGHDSEHDVIAPGAGRSIDMLTPAEAVELGEYMAAQWRAFADKHREAATIEPTPRAWPTIDSAPRDVMTPVLAWREGWDIPQWVHWCENPRTGTTFWNDWFEHDVYDNETEPPTHWWPVAPWPMQDEKRLTPTEALRAGMVSVDDLAEIGERIGGSKPTPTYYCDKCGAWTEEG